MGRILVENNSVKDAFTNNLGDLARAFEESGFNSARLDVAVEGQDRQEQGSDGRPAGPVFSQAIEKLEENTVYTGYANRDDNLVNLLA